MWWTHVILNKYRDPLGFAFDMALWIVATGLKIATFASLAALGTRAHRAIANDGRASGLVFATGAVSLSVLVGALSSTHDWWAPIVRNDSVTYYWPSMPGPAPGLSEWLAARSSGAVVAAELALALVLAGTHAITGYLFGRRPRLSFALGLASNGLTLLAYLRWCPWFLIEWDNFHGDLFAGALAFDIILPIANDPYTTIASTFYLAIWVTDAALLRFGLLRTTAPA